MFGFMDVHVFVFFFWQTYKMFIAYEGHSRYQIPWSPSRVIPFYYNSSYHVYHHTHNDGNYSTALYPIEVILGTNKSFFDRELGITNTKK
jgi:sterol desaturase/sphingolipid hydroxylase (fatty acid hydroxylase superfamily)